MTELTHLDDLSRTQIHSVCRKVLGTDPEQAFSLVPALRFSRPQNPGPKRIRVTYEDMLAVSYLDRFLTLARVDSKNIEIISPPQCLAGRLLTQNLIAIGSPKRNLVTKKILARYNGLGFLDR